MTIKCGKHAVPSLFTLQLPPPLSSIHAVLDSPQRPCHYAASHPIIAARVQRCLTLLLATASLNVRRLPEQWAETITQELRAVNDSAAGRLHRSLQRFWPAFVYKSGCAFDMLLLELAARKHSFFSTWRAATQNSEHAFWSPPRGRFRLANARKVGPSWGAGATPH